MSYGPQYVGAGSGGVTRRDFVAGTLAAGAVAGGGLGAFYFGYDRAMGHPLRVGVIGTGDEGSVLLGYLTPEFIQVKSIADIRPYNVWRAFHGDHSSETALEVRPGLMKKYHWSSESEARKNVRIYGPWQDLLDNASADGIEGVIIALPLHLHAPVAIAAMQRGLHVITEKLMGHTVHECKEIARVAEQTRRILATGHQRHYNILYHNAVDQIRRGMLGDLHYVRAQWHRGNMPDHDSWKMPLPPGVKVDGSKELEPQTRELLSTLKKLKGELRNAAGPAAEALLLRIQQTQAQIADSVLHTKDSKILDSLGGGVVAEAVRRVLRMEATDLPAEALGYEATQVKDAQGKVIYERPAIEELIRWRLWDRTAAGLMAELGSHQLDAASIFLAAAHDGKKPMPLNVAAAGNRPLFPADRDCEDHVYCIIEFPAPGYDPKDPNKARKKIAVQYSSINGNGFGGYGEIVYGTKGTLILEREQTMTLVKGPAAPTSVKTASGGAGPTMDTQASGPQGVATKAASEKVSRGYTEELEHWAWCIRHPSPENQPHCPPKVAMGDAIIALVTNMAAREGKRIEFKPEWFDPESDETPEGVKPDVGRYRKDEG
jgi:predicted dehydrogenase